LDSYYQYFPFDFSLYFWTMMMMLLLLCSPDPSIYTVTHKKKSIQLAQWRLPCLPFVASALTMRDRLFKENTFWYVCVQLLGYMHQPNALRPVYDIHPPSSSSAHDSFLSPFFFLEVATRCELWTGARQVEKTPTETRPIISSPLFSSSSI
jgi:hypothetical protein